MLDKTIGPLDTNRPSDGIGPLSHITDRIPPGESRTLKLEGEARLGPVQLGADAALSIARTQPTGNPPSAKLQFTFTVGATAAVGFQKEFGTKNAVGAVNGQVEAQVRADGKVSFTYEFDTSNPQHMAQLRDMSGALARAVPGVGGLVGGTDGPGVQQAFQNLSQRHVETKYQGEVTATVRAEVKAETSDKTQQLIARAQQAQAGLEKIQALNTSVQEAYGALGKSPPDFQTALGALQSHLPAGAQKAANVVADAQKAQQLYKEGKTEEALAVVKGYLPQGLQNFAQVATDASKAYQAMNSGDPAAAFEIMKGHLPAGAQQAAQMAADAKKAKDLQAEGKTEEAMQLLQNYMPEGMKNVSQAAVDAFRAQKLIGEGDATGAFNLMQQHLPAGAQSATQMAQAAQQAQQLVAEGKHAEAAALLTPFLPAGVANTVNQAQAGLNAYNAVKAAFEKGDLAGGLQAMQGAIAASQGLAGALKQQLTDLPGQIAAAKAAAQTLRDMPAQLKSQIQALPAQAKAQVQGLLDQAAEQVQGLRAQADALKAQAAALPQTATAQIQALKSQAQAPTAKAQEQAKALTAQAQALPETVRKGVMDQINAATTTPNATAAPFGSVQLSGSLSARFSQAQNFKDNTTTTTFGLTAQGTVAAESSLLGQTGASGAHSADIAIQRGPDGKLLNVSITRSFEGTRFAATSSRELVGDLDPQAIAGIEASDKVAVTQQIDLNALKITSDMSNAEIARLLASHAMNATPSPADGPVVRATATRTEALNARLDLVAASVAVRLERQRQRELKPQT
jgi:hypothetical protein